MASQESKRYLELQMEELKASHSMDTQKKNPAPKKNNKNAEIAKLYEDAAEYEEDLECFEQELVIIKASVLKDIATKLTQTLPDEERNYTQELKVVLEAGWTHLVDVTKKHPKEQLELIKNAEFCDAVEVLRAAYPDYKGDFETDVRNILLKRWEMLIAIKKEHIKEELEEIKTLGLKPNYVKRIYMQFHSIE
ncbi:MAG: hypothetical protein U9N52_07815 [Campylobacterota bacterium]|nr:hypothetical protein [Campylobacterota bacterium]